MFGFLSNVLPIHHRFCGKGLENVWHALAGIVESNPNKNRRELFHILRRLTDLDAVFSLSMANYGPLADYMRQQNSVAKRRSFITEHPLGREIAEWVLCSQRLKNLIRPWLTKGRSLQNCGQCLGFSVIKSEDNFSGEWVPHRDELHNCLRELPIDLRRSNAWLRGFCVRGFVEQKSVERAVRFLCNDEDSEGQDAGYLPLVVGYRSMCEWIYVKILQAIRGAPTEDPATESLRIIALGTNDRVHYGRPLREVLKMACDKSKSHGALDADDRRVEAKSLPATSVPTASTGIPSRIAVTSGSSSSKPEGRLPSRDKLIGEGFLTSKQLARNHDVPAEDLRKRLDRWRDHNKDLAGKKFTEKADREGRGAKWLYLESAVKGIIDDLQQIVNRPGKRPQRKK